MGTLSEQLEEPLDDVVDHEIKEPVEEDSCSLEIDEEITIEEKFTILESKYQKSQSIIHMLNRKIEFLESRRKPKKSQEDVKINLVDDDDTELIIKNENGGYRREAPQFEANSKKDEKPELQCKECHVTLESQTTSQRNAISQIPM